jgi:hypothetical protein
MTTDEEVGHRFAVPALALLGLLHHHPLNIQQKAAHTQYFTLEPCPDVREELYAETFLN